MARRDVVLRLFLAIVLAVGTLLPREGGACPRDASGTDEGIQLTYVANGPDQDDLVAVYAYGEELEMADCPFAWEGHTFCSWNAEPGGTGTAYEPGEKVQAMDITVDEESNEARLYAQWDEEADGKGCSLVVPTTEPERSQDVEVQVGDMSYEQLPSNGDEYCLYQGDVVNEVGQPFVDEAGQAVMDEETGDVGNVSSDSVQGSGDPADALPEAEDGAAPSEGAGVVAEAKESISVCADNTDGFEDAGGIEEPGDVNTWGNSVEEQDPAVAADAMVDAKTEDELRTLVVFDANCADADVAGSMAPLACEAGGSVLAPPCQYVRAYHTFLAWNTQADGCGTSYAPGDMIGGDEGASDEKLVLYAQWVVPQTCVTVPVSLNLVVKEDGSFVGIAGSGAALVNGGDADVVVEGLTVDVAQPWMLVPEGEVTEPADVSLAVRLGDGEPLDLSRADCASWSCRILDGGSLPISEVRGRVGSLPTDEFDLGSLCWSIRVEN